MTIKEMENKLLLFLDFCDLYDLKEFKELYDAFKLLKLPYEEIVTRLFNKYSNKIIDFEMLLK